MLRFQSAYLIALLVFVPFLWFVIIRARHRLDGSIRYSHVTAFFGKGHRPSYPLRVHISVVLIMLAVSLFILGAARPQLVEYEKPVQAMGRDIVLALDISGSMRAEDFQPHNRLFVAKKVVTEFVRSRTSDRIGLVTFAGQSFTQCPLTLDYDMLVSLLEAVDFDLVEDGTAIGNAIGTALNRLRDSSAKSKIIILLTDGENNRGEIEPRTAAEMAKTMNVKIYCVGVGKKGGAKIPVIDRFGRKRYAAGRDGRPLLTKLDEKTLQQIADISKGEYSRATDAESLKAIYKKIGEAEKSEIQANRFMDVEELMPYFVLPGLCLLLLGLAMRETVARVMP